MSEVANCTMQGRMSVFCPKNCKKCRLGVDNGPGLRYNNRRRREQHPGTPHGVCGRSSSGRAPPCQGGGSEFEPRRPLHLCGSLAQLGEHLPYKQRVSGSSPIRVASSECQRFAWQSCTQDRQANAEIPPLPHKPLLRRFLRGPRFMRFGRVQGQMHRLCLCSSVGRAGD